MFPAIFCIGNMAPLGTYQRAENGLKNEFKNDMKNRMKIKAKNVKGGETKSTKYDVWFFLICERDMLAVQEMQRKHGCNLRHAEEKQGWVFGYENLLNNDPL